MVKKAGERKGRDKSVSAWSKQAGADGQLTAVSTSVAVPLVSVHPSSSVGIHPRVPVVTTRVGRHRGRVVSRRAGVLLTLHRECFPACEVLLVLPELLCRYYRQSLKPNTR